jgi:hypothetical protein
LADGDVVNICLTESERETTDLLKRAQLPPGYDEMTEFVADIYPISSSK